MAVHARLSAPQAPAPSEWPWHEAKWSSIPAHILWTGDRRMEAETYLSSGYGLRLAIQERTDGWKQFQQLAKVTMPNRTKATLVGQEFGTPFLAATQVFDIRPISRKWLALEKTEYAAALFAKPGSILMTRSGNVGRVTLATNNLNGVLVSDDLLRIEPTEPAMWGWIYAYLRSSQARAIMIGAQYGHMIKHLETSHLDALPVPVVRESIAADFHCRTKKILALRNRAYQLTLEAEARFEQVLTPFKVKDWGEEGFTVRASNSFFGGRRRFEAIPHNPGVTAIRQHLAKNGKGFLSIRDAGFDTWLPGRFKRIPAEDGVWFLDSADLLETNPDLSKKIADGNFGDPERGRVKTGWLLLARSGQTYGINGSVVLATAALEGKIISDHVIRVAPRATAKIRVGYLHVALSHPLLGRPLVKSLAYGSSIPEIDTADFAALEVVRLSSREEDTLADLSEESAAARANADILERQLATDASQLVDRFLAGSTKEFVV